MCLHHISYGLLWSDQSAAVKDTKVETPNEMQTTTATFMEIIQSFL